MNNVTLVSDDDSLGARLGVRQRTSPAAQSRSSRRRPGSLRGLLSGLAFLAVRAPVYAGVLLLAAVASAAGLILFVLQAAVTHLCGNPPGPVLKPGAVIRGGPAGERRA